MIYTMHEGSLVLPFSYADSSMTILKFPAEKSSLTIVRGEMPPELSLAETTELQRNLFRREFKTVVLEETRKTVLGSSPALEGMEFFCMFEKSGIRQFQMNLLIKQRACFLTFSYTQPHAFDKEALAHWESIKSSFTPAPEWYQSLTGVPHE